MWTIIIISVAVVTVAFVWMKYRAPRRNSLVNPYPARGHWWSWWDGTTDGPSLTDSFDSSDSGGGDSGGGDGGGGD